MKFLLGIIIGILMVPLFGLLYVYLGYAPVATSAPPFPFERKLASRALKARIGKSALPQSPVPATEDNLAAGAKIYGEYCAFCHGLPGQPETPAARGEYPPPPQLFHGKGVSDDPPGETYWKVTNGIRLTGMPAYGALSDTERWQVCQLLANADKLPASVKAQLTQQAAVK